MYVGQSSHSNLIANSKSIIVIVLIFYYTLYLVYYYHSNTPFDYSFSKHFQKDVM